MASPILKYLGECWDLALGLEEGWEQKNKRMVGSRELDKESLVGGDAADQ